MADDEFFDEDDDFGDLENFDLDAEFDEDEDFDEGLTDSFDDVPDAGFDVDIERKQAEFERKVKREQYILSKPDKFSSSQRQRAARMLGEYGEPTTIKMLVAIYKKDPDPKVRDAAKESLEMFRALQEALNDEDPEIADMAMELVQNIVLHGDIGNEPRFNRKTLLPIIGVLAVTLIIFAGLALFLPSPGTGEVLLTNPQKTGTAEAITQQVQLQNPDTVTNTLLERYNALLADNSTLRLQLRAITAEEPGDVDCSVSFNNLDPLALPGNITTAEFPDLVDANRRIEQGVATIGSMITAFQEQCAELPVEETFIAEAFANRESLVAMVTELEDVPGLLANSGADVGATPTALPSATVTLTLTPTLTPTPTADALILNKHQTGIQSVISQMNDLRGANTLLQGYWDAASGGDTLVCNNLPAPTLPEDYVIPDEELKDVTANMLSARDSLNEGLALTRQSWQVFAAACRNGSVVAQGAAQSQVAETAKIAYDNAQATLDGTLEEATEEPG